MQVNFKPTTSRPFAVIIFSNLSFFRFKYSTVWYRLVQKKKLDIFWLNSCPFVAVWANHDDMIDRFAWARYVNWAAAALGKIFAIHFHFSVFVFDHHATILPYGIGICPEKKIGRGKFHRSIFWHDFCYRFPPLIRGVFFCFRRPPRTPGKKSPDL